MGPLDKLKQAAKSGEIGTEGQGELRAAIIEAQGGVAEAAAGQGERLGLIGAEKLPANYEAILRVRNAIAAIENYAARLGVAASDAPGIDRSGSESVSRDPKEITGNALLEEMGKDLAVVAALKVILGDRTVFDKLLEDLRQAEEALLAVPKAVSGAVSS